MLHIIHQKINANMTTPLDISNENLNSTRTTTIARRKRKEILSIRRASSAGMTSSATIERAVASAMGKLKDKSCNNNNKRSIDKDSSPTPISSKIRKVCIGESEVVVKTELLVDPATLLDEVTSSDLLQKNKIQSTTTKSTFSSSRGLTKTTTTTTTKTSKQYVNKSTNNDNKNISKEEASALRREARRVRNRESAAASRAKIRHRIEELEKEVVMWKNETMNWKEKYEVDIIDMNNDTEIEKWKSEAEKWKGKYEEEMNINENIKKEGEC